MTENLGRGLISSRDRRRPAVRVVWTAIRVALGAALVVGGAGPLYWTLKGSLSDTNQLLRHPLALWPWPMRAGNLPDAWQALRIGHFLLNTVVLVAGSWFVQLFVAITAGYALSILRPRFSRVVHAGIMVTLFVPGSVSLVALYLTVLHLPLFGVSIANSPLAVWLPAGAHAFNILIVKQFFDGLPRELIEAARVDGAGPLAIAWRIVLPMSRPILAVVSLFAVMNEWKNFLWPMVAISDSDKQPLAVALPKIAGASDQALLIAGLLIASLPPVLLFLAFQRQITRGVRFTGLKG
ncbi:carbohydrate ABC transporter permease [Rugosimonospora acidiphila]|uniref:Carbohydrate ABC transporter permease n=1 Tax=Rugosimonospora acidiphila TaxID=556531 RepID=A0ABP9SCH0_9ACTN